MKYNKPKSRRDKNHVAIQNGLIDAGYSVVDLSTVGGGCPDILVGLPGKDGTRGNNILIELKNGASGKLKSNQVDFFRSWRGEIYVARGIDEALIICQSHL